MRDFIIPILIIIIVIIFFIYEWKSCKDRWWVFKYYIWCVDKNLIK